jgi:hypothetical protein
MKLVSWHNDHRSCHRLERLWVRLPQGVRVSGFRFKKNLSVKTFQATMEFNQNGDSPGLLCHAVCPPLLERVEEEGAEERGVGVLGQLEQVADVELKVAGELQEKLVHAVEELQEDRATLVHVRRAENVKFLLKHILKF